MHDRLDRRSQGSTGVQQESNMLTEHIKRIESRRKQELNDIRGHAFSALVRPLQRVVKDAFVLRSGSAPNPVGETHNHWRSNGLCSVQHGQSTGAHELEGLNSDSGRYELASLI